MFTLMIQLAPYFNILSLSAYSTFLVCCLLKENDPKTDKKSCVTVKNLVPVNVFNQKAYGAT